MNETIQAQDHPYIFKMISANYEPLRFVVKDDEDQWTATLEQLNDLSYDYVKLTRISAFIDVGISPLAMAICYDGTLLLPATPVFQNPVHALEKFNLTLAEMLFGGIYCEAVVPNDISECYGNAIGYTRLQPSEKGTSNSFVFSARNTQFFPDNIRLLEVPTVKVSSLRDAIAYGRNVVAKLGDIPKEQILYAVTFYSRKQWAESLLHSWTSIERIAEIIWQQHIVSDSTKKRREFLLDSRTWPISTKLELFFQRKMLTRDVYDKLTDARKARNSFIHTGQQPTDSVAISALRCLFDILSLASSDFSSSSIFDSVVNMIETRNAPPKRSVDSDWSNVRYWRKLPPLPGETSWNPDKYSFSVESRPIIIAGCD